MITTGELFFLKLSANGSLEIKHTVVQIIWATIEDKTFLCTYIHVVTIFEISENR